MILSVPPRLCVRILGMPASKFAPGDGPFKFRTKLLGVPGYRGAAVTPPFDVPAVFGSKRVPIKGTVNKFPFRSTLCNMGGDYFFVVNKAMREGGKCEAGDMADIVIERDRAERKVDVPAYIKKVIATNKTAQKTWDSLSFTHQKEWVRAIDEAKKEETKISRVEKMMTALRAGKKVGF
jgi:hypothetical protein